MWSNLGHSVLWKLFPVASANSRKPVDAYTLCNLVNPFGLNVVCNEAFSLDLISRLQISFMANLLCRHCSVSLATRSLECSSHANNCLQHLSRFCLDSFTRHNSDSMVPRYSYNNGNTIVTNLMMNET